MGDGTRIAIKPTESVVYAPADAEVTIAATGHAYGLKTTNGAETLIHVGIDTVSMNGEGFDQKVAQTIKSKLVKSLVHLMHEIAQLVLKTQLW